MNLIFSADDNWGIGKDNELLFRVKGDLRRFRELTIGNAVIMGRRTFQSLPGSRPLPDRENIVLTRDKSFSPEGVRVFDSTGELLEYVEGYDSERLFVIGGAQVYNELLPRCGVAYITKIFAKAEADRFMPDFDGLKGWSVSEKSQVFEEDDISYQFFTYKRNK